MFTYICGHCGKKGLKPFGKRCAAVWRIAPYWFCNTDCARRAYNAQKYDAYQELRRDIRRNTCYLNKANNNG